MKFNQEVFLIIIGLLLLVFVLLNQSFDLINCLIIFSKYFFRRDFIRLIIIQYIRFI